MAELCQRQYRLRFRKQHLNRLAYGYRGSVIRMFSELDTCEGTLLLGDQRRHSRRDCKY